MRYVKKYNVCYIVCHDPSRDAVALKNCFVILVSPSFLRHGIISKFFCSWLNRNVPLFIICMLYLCVGDTANQ